MDCAILLDVEGEIGPSASRSHIPVAFDLREGVERLDLDFSFEPTFLEDRNASIALFAQAVSRFGIPSEEAAAHARDRIRNFLSLSLDDPEGFRGCAHRQGPRHRISISETEATPGFLPGPLRPGLWTATISVHLVASPRCAWRLRLSTRDVVGDDGGTR